MFYFVSQGVSIAFAAGASPGPFTSFLIGRTLAQGWRKSIILAITPLVTDIPIVIVVLLILKQFPPELIRVIQLVGGLYLLWIAYGSWRQFKAGNTSFKPEAASDGESTARTLAQGAVMGWVSPGPYIFWATINGPLLIQGLNQSVLMGLAFLVAFYGTFIAILCLYVLVFDRLRRIDERVTKGIFLVTLVVMVLFGLRLIGQGVGIISA
ncbi:MAG: LysE family transporter [Chloroflexota bacterium]